MPHPKFFSLLLAGIWPRFNHMGDDSARGYKAVSLPWISDAFVEQSPLNHFGWLHEWRGKKKLKSSFRHWIIVWSFGYNSLTLPLYLEMLIGFCRANQSLVPSWTGFLSLQNTLLLSSSLPRLSHHSEPNTPHTHTYTKTLPILFVVRTSYVINVL